MATPKSLSSKLVLCLGLISLVAAGCGGDGAPLATYPRNVDIEYRVTSPGLTGATLAYTNATGGMDTRDSVTLPFSITLQRLVEQYGNAAISAQTAGDGRLDLEILVDGESVKKESFSGTSYVTGTSVYVFP